MDEKELIERKALAFFLRLYNRKLGSKYRLLKKRESPDFEVKDAISGKRLGVEISHIFHDKKEAMMMLGRDPRNIHGIISAQDHVDIVMRILKQKADKIKRYDCDAPVILVIRDFSKVFSPRTLFDARLSFKVPSSGYSEIWYLSRTRPIDKWDKLVRIK